MMFWPSRPGSLGDGYWLKYCIAARLGPMPSGSSAAMSAGVIPYQPAGTLWLRVKPCTEPPGQAAATAQRYIEDAVAERVRTARRAPPGFRSAPCRRSKLPKKNSRLRRIGPPNDAAKDVLVELRRLRSVSPSASCDSLRKYSLLDVAVRRSVQYADPSNWLAPLRVTSDTCGPLERPDVGAVVRGADAELLQRFLRHAHRGGIGASGSADR